MHLITSTVFLFSVGSEASLCLSDMFMKFNRRCLWSEMKDDRRRSLKRIWPVSLQTDGFIDIYKLHPLLSPSGKNVSLSLLFLLSYKFDLDLRSWYVHFIPCMRVYLCVCVCVLVVQRSSSVRPYKYWMTLRGWGLVRTTGHIFYSGGSWWATLCSWLE